ncbi:MAG: ferrochelatase [Bdellovibrio sp.]
MVKKGVLLLNIGSPRSYEVDDVKKYLKTFLMDKDIINLPLPLRWFLVHGVIVPRRASFSAANYKKIWLEKEGSPLTVYTQRFAEGLQKELGPEYLVKVGMRYSEPSIEKALKEFATESVQTLILAPLYPQYAEATTGSSLKEVDRLMGRLGIEIPTETLPPFYNSSAFVHNTAQVIQETLGDTKPDHYLFSFHGLPESQVRKVEGCLTRGDCCFERNACEKNCYRAQCYATATCIAEELGLLDSHWSVAFQSRLGRAEWLKPATDHTLEILAKTEKKRIAVICPSFVADCIETLEEIGMGGVEHFTAYGGKEFHLIPCLNDSPKWIHDFAKTVTQVPITYIDALVPET